MDSFDIFRTDLMQVMRYLFDKYNTSNIIVAGDFNVNFINKTRQRNELSDVLASFGLTPLMHPSRVEKATST